MEVVLTVPGSEAVVVLARFLVAVAVASVDLPAAHPGPLKQAGLVPYWFHQRAMVVILAWRAVRRPVPAGLPAMPSTATASLPTSGLAISAGRKLDDGPGSGKEII